MCVSPLVGHAKHFKVKCIIMTEVQSGLDIMQDIYYCNTICNH